MRVRTAKRLVMTVMLVACAAGPAAAQSRRQLAAGAQAVAWIAVGKKSFAFTRGKPKRYRTPTKAWRTCENLYRCRQSSICRPGPFSHRSSIHGASGRGSLGFRACQHKRRWPVGELVEQVRRPADECRTCGSAGAARDAARPTAFPARSRPNADRALANDPTPQPRSAGLSLPAGRLAYDDFLQKQKAS